MGTLRARVKRQREQRHGHALGRGDMQGHTGRRAGRREGGRTRERRWQRGRTSQQGVGRRSRGFGGVRA